MGLSRTAQRLLLLHFTFRRVCCRTSNRHRTNSPLAVGMTMFIGQDDMPCTPELLQRLAISPSSCIFSRLLRWIEGLQKLRILKIAVRILLNSDIDTLTGLPVLAVLSLYVQKSNAESVVFNSWAIPALKYFKYRCCTSPGLSESGIAQSSETEALFQCAQS